MIYLNQGRRVRGAREKEGTFTQALSCGTEGGWARHREPANLKFISHIDKSMIADCFKTK